jgi:hypothetical protein
MRRRKGEVDWFEKIGLPHDASCATTVVEMLRKITMIFQA